MSNNTSEASWGPQASCQTKSVWHSACTGPIACIFYYGAEKPQVQLGGFSAPRFGLEKGWWMAGHYFTSLQSLLARGSGILNLREHARQNLQAQVFLVAQSVSPPLQNPNLVVQSFNKAQRYLVLRLTVSSNPIPVAKDHQSEVLVGSQTLPLQSIYPVLHEPSRPAFIAVTTSLAKVTLILPLKSWKPSMANN